MGRGHPWVIIFAAEPATDLRLPDSAVAEHYQLDIGHCDCTGAEIAQMGAQGLQTVLEITLGEHLRRDARHLSFEQVKVVQGGLEPKILRICCQNAL
jgi:hypothetical protein